MKSYYVSLDGINESSVKQEEIDDINLSDDEAIIKAEYSMISAGTELSRAFALKKGFKYPVRPGYCMVGKVLKNGKNIVIHKALTIPTPEGCYSDGVLVNIEVLAKAMKIAMDEHRFNSNNVAFSISTTRLATKEVLIPNVKLNKIAQIVEANATEYFPVNLDEYIIQHTYLEKVEDQGQEKIKILVAAAPTEVVESYYALAKALGLKVAFVDYAGNSTYQIMRQQVGEEVSLVIQVENDGTVVNIFSHNVLQLQRTVPYGKSLLVNAVMEKYGLKYDQAVAKLQDETVLHSRFDGDEVTESLRYLVGNVNRIIDYYVSRSHTSIEKSYLIGHATTIKGMSTLLSNEMNMPLIRVDTLKNIVSDKRTYVEEAMLTSYVTNFGAIVDPVDFMPRALVTETAKKDVTRNVVIMFIGAVAVAAMLVVAPLVRVVAVQAEIVSLNRSIKKLSTINDIVDSYYNSKDRYNDAYKFRQLSTDKDDYLGEFVDYLEQNVPSDIVISSMTVNSGAVTITGTGTTKSSVAKFIQTLQKSSAIDAVTVPSISESKDAADLVVLSFSLTCTLNGNPAEGGSK